MRNRFVPLSIRQNRRNVGDLGAPAAPALAAAGPRATGPARELAERLGVTTRTVRNDVDRLRDLGYPVHATPGRGRRLPARRRRRAAAAAARRRRGGRRRGRPAHGGRRHGRRHRGDVGPRARQARAGAARRGCGTGSHAARRRRRSPVPTARSHGRRRRADRPRRRLPGPAAAALRLPRPRRRGRPCASSSRTAWSTLGAALVPRRLGRRPRPTGARSGSTGSSPRTPTGPRFAPRDPPGGDVADVRRQGARHRHVALPRPGHRARARGARSPSGCRPRLQVEPVDEHTCVVTVGSDNPHMLALYLGLLDADFTVDPTDSPALATHLHLLSTRYSRATRPSPSI